MNDIMVSTQTVRQMVSAGVIEATMITAVEGGGFALRFRPRGGAPERVLQSWRGHERRYASIDTAATQVRALGLVHVELDLSNLEVTRVTHMTRDRQRRLPLT